MEGHMNHVVQVTLHMCMCTRTSLAEHDHSVPASNDRPHFEKGLLLCDLTTIPRLLDQRYKCGVYSKIDP
jgi:hypothetical protein